VAAVEDGTTASGQAAGIRELLDRFLSDRRDRTLQAYSADIEDFARFMGTNDEGAVAQLLGAGPEPSRRLLLDYAIELRRRGRAPATVGRRLATLRGVGRLAHETGLTDWALEAPDESEVDAAVEARDSDRLPYLFPRHAAEVDRLDVQHYALREALGGNYLAPVEDPAAVLDAGSGTGQWGFEVAERFPRAMVVGVDLVPSKPDRPPNYRMVRANLLTELPFAGESFDFVHQRLLVVGLPLPEWPRTAGELARVTRPGGWVELVEPATNVQDAGPATERVRTLAMGMMEAVGLDTGDEVFLSLDGYLRHAGLEEIVRRQVSIPIGPWGGRVGSFMATDMRAMQMRVGEVLQARGIVSGHEWHELVQVALDESVRLRMSFHFAVVYARKPRRRQ
jgi:SAM-dependent methyltransferase